jgi:uncharacterized membrane protein
MAWIVSDEKARAGLTLLVVSVAAILIGIVEWRYAIFRNGVDLGIFSQVIASTGSGFSSTAEGGANHLLVHWSPLIVAAWPFLHIFGPVGLEICQALLISATLVPLWGVARARFSPPIALAMVAACAIYPILSANAVGDFHEMAFVPLLSATFVYALDQRRWPLGVASAVLLACTKEDQFVALAFAGAMCVAFGRRDRPVRRFGLSVTAIAVAGAIAYFGIVRNLIQPHAAYYSIHFFDWSASSVSIGTLPALLESRGMFLIAILAPLAFLPCFSRYGLFLIPGFVEIFASHEPVTLMAAAHYSALLTGYALVAFIDGASRIAAAKPRIAKAAVAAAIGISIWVSVFASPMEYWYYLYRRPDSHDAKLESALGTLPRNAEVGAEDEIFSHLGLDPRASIDLANQEWFVYDTTHYSDRWRRIDEPIVTRLIAQRVYSVASSDDGIVILRRTGAGKPSDLAH